MTRLTPTPRWAHVRAEKRAGEWGPQAVLLAYPRTRGLFAVPFVALPIGGVVSAAAPIPLIVTADSATQMGVGVGLMVFIGALFAGVTVLVIDAFRTSLLATARGLELRQPFFRTRLLHWEEIHRVEVRTHGYWSGASEFVLKTGERVLSKATDPRRAIYNGFRIRDHYDPDGRTSSPTTAELVRLHRAWLDGNLA